jgi:hypothetical protein
MMGKSKPAACAVLAMENAVTSDVTKLKHAPERDTAAGGAWRLRNFNNSDDSRER